MLASGADLNTLLLSPTYSSDEKKDVLLALHAKLKSASEITSNFIQLLAKKKRLDLLAEAVVAFNAIVDEANNILDAVVESATALSEKQEGDIRSYLENRYQKTIRLRAVVNETLGGGYTILVGDQLIDFSVQSQLNKLKKQLVAS